MLPPQAAEAVADHMSPRNRGNNASPAEGVERVVPEIVSSSAKIAVPALLRALTLPPAAAPAGLVVPLLCAMLRLALRGQAEERRLAQLAKVRCRVADASGLAFA